MPDKIHGQLGPDSNPSSKVDFRAINNTPGKIHAQLGPDSKFNSVSILSSLQDIATHNKTYESLVFVCDKIENAIHNNNMDLAKTWLEKVYARLEKISVKNPVSETELTEYLDNKYRVLEFTRQLNKTAKATAAVMKYAGVFTKSITLLKDIGDLAFGKDDSDNNEAITQLQANRDKLKEGYAKMKLVMDCISILGELAPTGVDSMIEFSVGVFEGAEKAVKAAYDHAEEIEKRLAELNNDVRYNEDSKSLKTSDLYIKLPNNFNGTKYDYNDELDRLYGNPSTKHHKKRH